MTGEVLWSKVYARTGSSHESLFAFTGDSEGNAYGTGRFSTTSQGDDIVVLKFAASNGDVEWIKTINGENDGDDRGWDLAIGTDGNPVVTGITTIAGGNAQFLTAKLSSSNGSDIWKETHPGAINNIHEPAGWLAICNDGDIVMANRTWSSATSYDVVLFRYDQSDGTVIWDRQFNSSGSTSDNPMDMILDSNGDIVVTGVTGSDYMILKFAGDDNELIWSSSYDGPPGWYDLAKTVVEGQQGEAIVSGFSDGSGSGWDIATVGFDGLTGDQLWVIRDGGADNQSDEGNALAIHGSDGLYVVGYISSHATESDIAAYSYRIDETSSSPELIYPSCLLTAEPNPLRSETLLAFELAVDSPITLAIYSTEGRCLRVLEDRMLGSGRHQVAWSGTDQRGQNLASGVYYAIIEGRDFSQTQRIVLAR